MARGDRGPRDLGEHGLEDEVVLVRDDDGLRGIPAGAPQILREAFAAGDAGETAAEDGDFEIEAGGFRSGHAEFAIVRPIEPENQRCFSIHEKHVDDEPSDHSEG